MNKAEHYQRIIQSIRDSGANAAALSALDALADEVAALCVLTDDLSARVQQYEDRQPVPLAVALKRAEFGDLAAEALSEALRRAEVAEAQAAEAAALWREFGIEGDESVRDIVVRLNAAATRLAEEKRAARQQAAAAEARSVALVDRLVRLHRAVTEEGASEKIVLILAEPEPAFDSPFGEADPLAEAERRAARAESALAGFQRGAAERVSRLERERDEDAANARRLLDTRDALLVTIADRQRDACAAECRASALPDAEIFTNLVLGTPLESVSVTEPELEATDLAGMTFEQIKTVATLAQARALRWAADSGDKETDRHTFEAKDRVSLFEIADRIERGEIKIP